MDWDAVAGVTAAVLALVLHLLHVVDQTVLLAITLVILALMLIRDLRREGRDERVLELAEGTEAGVRALRAALTPKETVSFILTETEPDGVMEAHVSFWGEPFMSRATGRESPRYIFHVQGHSELIGRLVELKRHYRRS